MVWSSGKSQSPLGLSLAAAINYCLYDLEPSAESLWASISSSVKWGGGFHFGATDVKFWTHRHLKMPFPAPVLSVSPALDCSPPHTSFPIPHRLRFPHRAARQGGHGPSSFLLGVSCLPLLPGPLDPIQHSPDKPVSTSTLACPAPSQNLEGRHCVLFSGLFPLFHILSGT